MKNRMSSRIMLGFSLISLSVITAAPCMGENKPPACVALTDGVNLAEFVAPPALLWPGPFWLWNAPLDSSVLDAQLRDMADHGFRNICMLPMPHAFRPDSTNNLLDPDYLTEGFLAKANEVAKTASELGVAWWLYDEGGWPSGQAVGKVTEGHPEFRQQRLVRKPVSANEAFTVPDSAFALIVETPEQRVFRPGETWTPASGNDTAYLYTVSRGGYVDLMNPAATQRFIELTHEAYRRTMGNLIGNTVWAAFTDEPGCPNLKLPESITWTEGMDGLYRERYGHDITDCLPALFTPPAPDMPVDAARARIAFYDLWTARFRDAYFGSLRDWCRNVGMASGGHLNGEDETVNAVRYGFGQALRQLRAMDVPGVDLIWRQLFPGRSVQHFFPKYASSAAHQNGSRFAFTESFCVYGNGLTPAQMRWLVDYQYVRGLNQLVVGCFPLTTRDHHMTGERPHFGAVDPLWDHLRGFNAYVARLGYLLSSGRPAIHTALYYPVRDLWAWGESMPQTVQTHDALAQALLERQCDFDLIDDDLLADPNAAADSGWIAAGAMRYDTIVCGDVRWMMPASRARLEAFAAQGGTVICLGAAPGTEGTPGSPAPGFVVIDAPSGLDGHLHPTAVISPAAPDLRAAAREVREGQVLMLFNEGESAYSGALTNEKRNAFVMDAHTGKVLARKTVEGAIPVHLGPGESIVLLLANAGFTAPAEWAAEGEPMALDALITATPRRQYVAGEHDFETITPSTPPAPFAQTGVWSQWLTADYSGEVDYTATIDIPSAWKDRAVRLETGPVEYAATVLVDDAVMGTVLWPPWSIDLPPMTPGKHTLTIRVANTLANELTSQRVADEWAKKKGPGWPSPYHERAIVFEKESRGGGIAGPVRLIALH